MKVYYAINKIGTFDYYSNDKENRWLEAEKAMGFSTEQLAFAEMRRNPSNFKFPCKIEKIYHLK